uniref:Uncharacterized protein n=1 Tax=uncultured SAR11 cluster alpha proteobacterium H17925_45G17 TaxID=715038 RepID=E7CA40_9PROT|nr:hypothetical protein [uncultured SAR11 cluster alpha proteobacterium H17925_45G17]
MHDNGLPTGIGHPAVPFAPQPQTGLMSPGMMQPGMMGMQPGMMSPQVSCSFIFVCAGCAEAVYVGHSTSACTSAVCQPPKATIKPGWVTARLPSGDLRRGGCPWALLGCLLGCRPVPPGLSRCRHDVGWIKALIKAPSVAPFQDLLESEPTTNCSGTEHAYNQCQISTAACSRVEGA